jgi:hypothetical protein
VNTLARGSHIQPLQQCCVPANPAVSPVLRSGCRGLPRPQYDRQRMRTPPDPESAACSTCCHWSTAAGHRRVTASTRWPTRHVPSCHERISFRHCLPENSRPRRPAEDAAVQPCAAARFRTAADGSAIPVRGRSKCLQRQRRVSRSLSMIPEPGERWRPLALATSPTSLARHRQDRS